MRLTGSFQTTTTQGRSSSATSSSSGSSTCAGASNTCPIPGLLPTIVGRELTRARPPLDPQAAVQVLGAHTRRLLGHRCAGRRLLRPLLALLRHGAGRIPPPPRAAARLAGARV